MNGLRVLFVCTANISRSPYAERRARSALGEDADVTVASAGVPGFPGRDMDPEMAALLRQQGLDDTGHVSRQVDAALMDAADLVLTFEFTQHMRLLDAYPQHAAKVFGLRQFADAVAAMDEGVGDSGRGASEFGGAGLGDSRFGVAGVVQRAALVAPPDSISSDVADPYRRGPRAARAAASGIDGLLDRILPALTDRPVRALIPAEADAHAPQPPPRQARRRSAELVIGSGIALLAVSLAATIAVGRLYPGPQTAALIAGLIVLGGVGGVAGLVMGARARSRGAAEARPQGEVTGRPACERAGRPEQAAD